ncbi:hypothetical protein M2459_002648 [Parabacteroides sp. PF5-5]|uniref:DUF4834 family protein n=1 Tax=unclassified Parabacteroides TaxID=2649774 RepID=UPI0024761053|nr:MULTISPECIES: DUF4834 family protein [unclassified Parabacteroides]MDH6306285.1 hypothetical protein [Parabacteroides sp. PH5-39]MDH6316924.1 hypothetical protein [Parabacteroides sp. PF5-13]MDH6320993.1 hypothetical protein [Parabacteroides sp. PH5-13]MDH6324725.1 hypothetical protein [Parabacteroides sp. PH5-8]MDH6328109.1 hypothetical protein [Parabacteroides sp. PH5-41]
MFKFLFVIFFFIILMTLMLGLSFLRTLKRVLFGESESEKRARQQRQAQANGRQKSTGRQETSPPKKKIFPKDEGEYVDYEEIKE